DDRALSGHARGAEGAAATVRVIPAHRIHTGSRSRTRAAIARVPGLRTGARSEQRRVGCTVANSLTNQGRIVASPVSQHARQVPLLDLRAQYATIRDEIRVAIDRVLESLGFILGPEVAALEQEIAAYTGTAQAVGMSSGTDALLAALMACDVGPGDEVVTTPYSFFATAGVVARLGARAVFRSEE